MNENLEFRMYGFVPYNLSDIQKGIQFGHAVVEYQLIHDDVDYQKWAKFDKTFMILNGGTSNHSKNRYSTEEFSGTMEEHRQTLIDNGIKIAEFYEPDLNDMLSGIVFLVDERVWDKEKYPDFYDFLRTKHTYITHLDWQTIEQAYPNEYKEWYDMIGDEKQHFLRNFLKLFRLA